MSSNRTCEDEFRDACGLDAPLRLEVRGPRPGDRRTVVLRRPFALIGRDPAMDIVVDDPDVGRRHAFLLAIAGRVFCVDLMSRTGIAWDSGPAPQGWIGRGPGQAVQVGPARIRLDGEPPPGPSPDPWPTEFAHPLSSRPQAHDALPAVLLEDPGREGEAAPWIMRNALVLLGRSPDCRVRLDDPAVALAHAALIRTPQGPWAIDLTAQGRLAINGEAVPFGRLDDGDELRVGPRPIVVRCPAGGIADPGTALQVRPSRGRGRPAVAGPPSAEILAPRDGDADPATADLIAEMARMQEQMFGQIHQAMGLLAQVVGDLRRDQAGRMDETLDRLRQLEMDLRARKTTVSPVAARSPKGPKVDAEPPPESVPVSPGDLYNEIARHLGALEADRRRGWQRFVAVKKASLDDRAVADHDPN